MYEKRAYRNLIKTDGLVQFEVIVKETDLFIQAEKDLSREAREFILKYRRHLETYIRMNPEFLNSFIPIENTIPAPDIVQEMIRASRLTGVGPMAAVAGAMAEWVLKGLFPFSNEVIVENGGDICLAGSKERTVGIYAGSSPLSLKIGVAVDPEETPLGICTSSGTVGHSVSFGKADAVCVVSKSATLADAAATGIGNIVQGQEDIGRGLERGKEIEGVSGVLIIVGEKMGAWGKMRLVKL
jgi:ApbE superfamily uncharacterized protein (UPF0280 family)